MHHSLSTDRVPRQLWLSPFLVLTLTAVVLAKCPTGSVSLTGTVSDLPSSDSGVELIATVKTPKGDFSQQASVSKGQFAVAVPFSTLSSSFMGGDRCHNLPKMVEVRVTGLERVYAEKKLEIKENFEAGASYVYRLKHPLYLDITSHRR